MDECTRARMRIRCSRASTSVCVCVPAAGGPRRSSPCRCRAALPATTPEMAPKKKASAKSSAASAASSSANDEAVKAVQSFLSAQNRPFSVQNIVDGLQAQGFKKTAVERALAELAASAVDGERDHDDDEDGEEEEEEKENGEQNGGSAGAVTCKEYGKTRVYITKQSNIELPSPEEMQRLGGEITDKSAELERLTSECATLQSAAAQLEAQPTTEEAHARVAELTRQVAAAERERADMEERTRGFDEERRQAIVKAYVAALRAWKQRRRAVDDIVKQMADGMEKRPGQVYELMGLETDAEAGAPAIESMPAEPAQTTAGPSAKRRRV